MVKFTLPSCACIYMYNSSIDSFTGRKVEVPYKTQGNVGECQEMGRKVYSIGKNFSELRNIYRKFFLYCTFPLAGNSDFCPAFGLLSLHLGSIKVTN